MEEEGKKAQAWKKSEEACKKFGNEKERGEGIFRVRVTGGDVELKPALCGNRFSLNSCYARVCLFGGGGGWKAEEKRIAVKLRR